MVRAVVQRRAGFVRAEQGRSRRIAQFGITFGECIEGYAVPPGGSCGVAVILTPSVEGPLSGAIKISESGFGATHRAVEDHRRRRVAGVDGRPGQLPPLRDVEGRRDQARPTRSRSPTSAWCRRGSPTWRSRGPIPKDFKIVRTKCRNAVLQISAGCTVDVAFAPKEAGHRSATVVVGTDTGQYTSVLVDGDAHYTPAIQAAGTDVIAGNEIGVGGSGFAPNATITLAVGRRRRATHHRPADDGGQLPDLDARRRQRAPRRSRARRPDARQRHRSGFGRPASHLPARRRSRRRLPRLARRLIPTLPSRCHPVAIAGSRTGSYGPSSLPASG